MTKITHKSLERETDVKYRGEALAVDLQPKGLWIWRKNRRAGCVFVTYEAVYELGLKLAARRER